jgi:Uma2 family endonuclease
MEKYMTTTPMTLPPPVLPLQQDEHLTREEFERRYDAMPDLKKAELIQGVVHMGSPVSWVHHATPHFDVITWLGLYRASTPGTCGGDNGSCRLDLNNEPQPDAALIIEPSHGGQVHLSQDGYIEGGPELIVEVAASSASLDMNAKRTVYQRNGVREYIVWRVLQQQLDWFILREGNYEELQPHADGTLRSEVFPGLWLDRAALLQGDLLRVLAVLQQGLASPEHAAFVVALQQAAAP